MVTPAAGGTRLGKARASERCQLRSTKASSGLTTHDVEQAASRSGVTDELIGSKRFAKPP
jgi:hypothetical protein